MVGDLRKSRHILKTGFADDMDANGPGVWKRRDRA
jgi:hypothetical protein